MNCKECGKLIERRVATATLCLTCRPARIAAPDRVREGVYMQKRINGAAVCLDCDAPVERTTYPGSRCVRRPLRCRPCAMHRSHILHSRRAEAGTLVAKAIREGRLQRPSAFACVDCGRAAEQYDHRDYTQPLAVEPVCRSCNVLRGPAPLPPIPKRDAIKAAA